MTERYADELFDDVYAFLGRFVSYPGDSEHVAHALWVGHAHLMPAWESTPRIAFLSPEPASGKTRALEATELLVPNPVVAVNVTPAYLFRKVGDAAGPPTVLFDEIDTVFGPKAKENEEIRGLLNAGHRRGAVAGRCVLRGKVVETEEIPAYCAVAMAGLGGLPDTILSRAVVIRMKRRAPSEQVEPFRRRVHEAEGHRLRDALADWAAGVVDGVRDAWPDIPNGIEDRDADVWEPLLAVADAAGGDWPERARVSAVSLVSAAKVGSPSLGIRLLTDIRDCFAPGAEVISTSQLLEALCAIEDSPWGDLRGRPLNSRGLGRRLADYQVSPVQVRIGDRTMKGYRREAFYDAWARYLPPPVFREEEIDDYVDQVVLDNNQEQLAFGEDEGIVGSPPEESETSETSGCGLPAHRGNDWFRPDGTGPVCGHCHPPFAEVAS